MSEKHYYKQKEFTTSYLIPYFQEHLPGFEDFKILEIGCAEAGSIAVFNELGIDTVGLELSASRVETAKEKSPELTIFVGDITDEKIVERIGDGFDLIVMRDAIEHIPDREATFSNIRKLLKKNGFLYITFPPRFSGFAGHQQNGRSVLRFIPYLHLLPEWLIRFSGKIFNERPNLIDVIVLNYKMGLSIRAFNKYCSRFKFEPVVKELYFLRPIYKIRFNVNPKKFPNIPFLREVFAFGCEYLLKKEN